MHFASIGDCCVDTYPGKKILGGTSYNSALVAKACGVDVSIISAVGADKSGKAYISKLQAQHISTECLYVADKPTSSVDVILDKTGSPIFGKWELGALANWQLSQKDLKFIRQHDVAKMIFLKPLNHIFTSFYETNMKHTVKVGDFAGNSQYSYTPTELEKYADGLDIIVKGLGHQETDAIEFMKQLAQRKNKIVLLTLGEKGSICFAEGKTFLQEAIKIKTKNTTGFGDAFLAVFLISYYEKHDIQRAMLEATDVIATLHQN